MKVSSYKSAFHCIYSDESTDELEFVALSSLPQNSPDIANTFSYIETIIHRNISKHQVKNSIEFYEIDIRDIEDHKYKNMRVYTPEDLTIEDLSRLNYEISESKKKLKKPTGKEAKRYVDAYNQLLKEKNKVTLTVSEIKKLKKDLNLEHIEIFDKTWMNEK